MDGWATLNTAQVFLLYLNSLGPLFLLFPLPLFFFFKCCTQMVTAFS